MIYSEITSNAPVVLVEFYASWCPHCQKMMPVVGQVKSALEGRAPVFQLDIDANRDAANEAGVKSIPTFIIYKDGSEVWRQSGEMDAETLLGKVESCL